MHSTALHRKQAVLQSGPRLCGRRSNVQTIAGSVRRYRRCVLCASCVRYGFSSVNDRLLYVIVHVTTDTLCRHLVADKLFRQLIEMFVKGFREVLYVGVTELRCHLFQ